MIKFHKKLQREINIVRNIVYKEPLIDFDLEDDQPTKTNFPLSTREEPSV